MTNANPHAIAELPLVTNSDQNVADVGHLIVEPQDNRTDPILLRHRPGVFDGEVMNVVGAVLGIGGDCGCPLARLQTQSHRKKHDAGATVRSPGHGRAGREWFVFLRY